MESAQRELIGVLLDHIRTLGLISDFTYSKAMDLVHSAADFPELFQVPVCLTKEAEIHECTQDTQRNDGFNQHAQALEKRLEVLRAETEKGRRAEAQLTEIRAALEQELSFRGGVNSALVVTILDKIVVKEDSTKEHIHLDIHLKFGGPWEAAFNRANPSLCFTRPRTDKANEKIFCGEGQAVFRRQGKAIHSPK